MATAPKHKLSKTRRDAIKAKYAGRSATYKRSHVATTKGKKLSEVAGGPKKRKPTDLKKKFAGNRAGYVKAMKARSLAKSAHKKAVLRGRQVARSKKK
jgi:hypothetical protein|tara:strand:- start:43 stop:336 length:294 start_codon:yes stop_codon:yes gene_type:complete